MKIKLTVPYFSQRKNKYIWTHDDWIPDYRKNKAGADQTPGQTGERSCNVTCLSMVLNYYKFQNITPDSIMKKLILKEQNYIVFIPMFQILNIQQH